MAGNLRKCTDQNIFMQAYCLVQTKKNHLMLISREIQEISPVSACDSIGYPKMSSAVTGLTSLLQPYISSGWSKPDVEKKCILCCAINNSLLLKCCIRNILLMLFSCGFESTSHKYLFGGKTSLFFRVFSFCQKQHRFSAQALFARRFDACAMPCIFIFMKYFTDYHFCNAQINIAHEMPIMALTVLAIFFAYFLIHCSWFPFFTEVNQRHWMTWTISCRGGQTRQPKWKWLPSTKEKKLLLGSAFHCPFTTRLQVNTSVR